MPNWAEGSLKLRGRSENISSALKENAIKRHCNIRRRI